MCLQIINPLLGHKLIWKTWAPLRIKIFLWLAFRRRHWTGDRRLRHGLEALGRNTTSATQRQKRSNNNPLKQAHGLHCFTVRPETGLAMPAVLIRTTGGRAAPSPKPPTAAAPKSFPSRRSPSQINHKSPAFFAAFNCCMLRPCLRGQLAIL